MRHGKRVRAFAPTPEALSLDLLLNLLLNLADQLFPPLEGFRAGLLDERLIVIEGFKPMPQISGRIVEVHAFEKPAVLEGNRGKKFSRKFLLCVDLAPEGVRGVFPKGVPNFMEQGCVIIGNRLEGVLIRHLDCMLGGRVVSRASTVADRGRVLGKNDLGKFNRGEGNDLVRPLEVGKPALGDRENRVETANQIMPAFVLLFHTLPEGDRETLCPRFYLPAKGFGLLVSEVVVIAPEEGEHEGINALVRLTADAVLGANGRPRLLPRGDSVFEGLDEAVSDNIGNRGL